MRSMSFNCKVEKNRERLKPSYPNVKIIVLQYSDRGHAKWFIEYSIHRLTKARRTPNAMRTLPVKR